ncbi:uncharacterized protein K452DRAFT_312736 [Aplosporella prunicola CBS 121167]|uniref:Ketoreductase (KR) domain-containing protein n=1 Tax=Aplosporella prunicola CBS 121167 TaxID=1176127 RepID=A0A6A6B128_9PEZI|nr:uncharacterized protein K452DRAFT_312736 [Aplosporella prunicola CBS 121167]KAF2136924.1 hypothetical protein K452DRAFT_312736 [Aplosporella prunicola CBS 121167]
MPTFNPAKDIPDLSGKVILITGGTSGIGLTSVHLLAPHKPSHIYFTGRNATAAESVISAAQVSAPTVPVTFIPLDLAGPRTEIRATLAPHFSGPDARLNILIANASIMATPPGLTTEG